MRLNPCQPIIQILEQPQQGQDFNLNLKKYEIEISHHIIYKNKIVKKIYTVFQKKLLAQK